jgi:sugar phosphate permease
LQACRGILWLWFVFCYISDEDLSNKQSDWLSTLFDVGGIIGGIATGLLSDVLNARALSCVLSLILAVPSLFLLRFIGDYHISVYIVLLILSGIFINGPCAIITTAVSSDLGTHKTIKNNQNAKATVTAIIDGTGSIGAALGPLLIGWLSGTRLHWNGVFYALMISCLLSAVFMLRLLVTEVLDFIKQRSSNRASVSPCPAGIDTWHAPS